MPLKTSTREQYARRLDKVLTYLSDHLDEPFDLYRLADEAHLSPYHFHRVYVAMLGETVADTVKRLRLHRAAVKLIASGTPVARVATEAGYGSVQAFSRAFRAAHGIPPVAYRQRGASLYLKEGIERGLRHPQRPRESIMYEVSIEQREPQRVVCLEHRGEYTEIGRAFERLAVWAAGKNLLGPDSKSFGIYYDDPSSMPAKDLRSDACLTVPADFKAEGEHKIKQTPGGRCAVLIHTGPYSELHRAYDWVYCEWLPKSGEAPGEQPCFEEYLNDPRQVPPAKLRTAVCIPLKSPS